MSDLHDEYQAMRFRTEAERLRIAAADLHSAVMRTLVARLADDYDVLAARLADRGQWRHSNDD